MATRIMQVPGGSFATFRIDFEIPTKVQSAMTGNLGFKSVALMLARGIICGY
jgi:hypothetical protein